jgi:uncharacterized LabA/DUF88 family protein
MCLRHLIDKYEASRFYRVFFYDCPPLNKKVHNPISRKAIDFAKTPEFDFRVKLHKELIKTRKVALRLGRLSDYDGGWSIKPEPTKRLLSKKITIEGLSEKDVHYNVVQKGVGMRIGLDIASLSFKGLVKRLVLITGDSDFVPAAKFARREGVDIILDPMWHRISDDLLEHIDG